MLGNNSKEKEIDFSALFEVLLRRKKIIYLTSSIALTSSLIFSTIQRIINPTYSGNFVFLVNNPLEGSSSKGALGIADQQKSLGVFSNLLTSSTQQDIPTLISLLKSPSFLKSFANKNELNPIRLSKKLEITSQYDGFRQSSKGTIKVQYQSRDPNEVLKTLVNLKDFYLDVALKERRKQLSDGIKFLDEQGPLLEQKAMKYQDQLAAFRIKHNLVDPNPESTELKKRLEFLDVQIINTTNKGYRFLEIQNEIELGNLSVGGFSEVIDTGIGRIGMTSSGGMKVKNSDSSFLQKTLKLENDLALARTTFLPTSKIVKNLEKKIELLKPEIKKQQLESLDMSISLNNSKLISLEEEKKGVNLKFLKQANLIEPFNYIKSNLQYARLAELDLISTKEKFLLELAQKRNTWRLLQDPIVKPFPIKPSFLGNILIALLGGSFLGILISFYRDFKDNVFHSSKELEDTNLPILGKIIYTDIFNELKNNKNISDWFISFNDNLNKNKQDNQKTYQKFFYQEAFRNLFTSIKFIGSENPLRTIVVTSSEASEGKSLISLMLSKTLSEIDQNILLIDCDMRRPQLHKRLNLNNIKGLTNILTEKDGIKNWEKFAQEIPNHNCWKIITCGTVPPDPTRILSSNKLREFVNLLSSENKFDLIIFDTPPSGVLSDASLLGSICDGLIFVASIDKVDKEIFAEAINKLDSLGNKVLGLVTNECLKPKRNNKKLSYEYQEVYNAYKDSNISSQRDFNLDKIDSNNNTIFSKYLKKLAQWLDN